MKTPADFEGFRSYLQEQKLSESSITSYIGSLRLFGSMYPSLTASTAKKYRIYLIANYKPSTVNQRICGFNHYLDYAGKTKYKLPSVRLQRASYLDAIISNKDYLALKRKLKKKGPELWFFVVWFLGATGARVSELLKIKVEHLAVGYMDLYSKGGKMRRIYIPDALCREAEAWCHRRQTPSGYLFINRQGRPLTPRGVNSRLKHYAKLYKIDPKTVYPHSFRHRFAINFLQRFNDIALLADLLGHDNVETTRIYLTRSTSEQQKMIDKMVTW